MLSPVAFACRGSLGAVVSTCLVTYHQSEGGGTLFIGDKANRTDDDEGRRKTRRDHFAQYNATWDTLSSPLINSSTFYISSACQDNRDQAFPSWHEIDIETNIALRGNLPLPYFVLLSPNFWHSWSGEDMAWRSSQPRSHWIMLVWR